MAHATNLALARRAKGMENWLRRNATGLRKEIRKRDGEWWPNHTQNQINEEPLVHLNRNLVEMLICEMHERANDIERFSK
jgi:hypothetical protein